MTDVTDLQRFNQEEFSTYCPEKAPSQPKWADMLPAVMENKKWKMLINAIFTLKQKLISSSSNIHGAKYNFICDS